MKILLLTFVMLSSNLVLGEELSLEAKIEEIKRLPDNKRRGEIETLLRTGHKALTYREAQTYLFTVVDSEEGRVCGVYSPDECIETNEIPDHKIMNVEHSWPQSDGATGMAKSDLHHLYVATNATNSIRSSLPFCDVAKVEWTNKWSKRGLSSYKEHCFEPPKEHKGDLARAFFYFALRYNMTIDKYQETFFRKWHEQDPVSAEEREREQKISKIQRNHNLFVLYPELVGFIKDF